MAKKAGAADGRAGAADAEGLVQLVRRYGLETVVAGEAVGRARDRRIQPDDSVVCSSSRSCNKTRSVETEIPAFRSDVMMMFWVPLTGLSEHWGQGAVPRKREAVSWAGEVATAFSAL